MLGRLVCAGLARAHAQAVSRGGVDDAAPPRRFMRERLRGWYERPTTGSRHHLVPFLHRELSTGATKWMPALFTRMSTEPKAFLRSAIISEISAGWSCLAGEQHRLDGWWNLPMPGRSICVASPKPLMTILALAPANERAIASPMPLVGAGHNQALLVNVPIWVYPVCRGAPGAIGAVARKIVGHHGGRRD